MASEKERPITESKRIRDILGISRSEFSRRYNIPLRSLENWDRGIQNPPVYVYELLERAVKEDAKKELQKTLKKIVEK